MRNWTAWPTRCCVAKDSDLWFREGWGLKLQKCWMKLKIQEIDWRFWAAVPVVVLVLWVGLRVFHRCFQLGRSLSVDGLAMIGTTLVAAAAGFLAILYQVRSSSRQLRDQIEADRARAAHEKEEQKRAIAAAIVNEIDNICLELDQVQDNIKHALQTPGRFPLAIGFRANTSLIYKAIAPSLGILSAEAVSAIVRFYSKMGSYEGMWRVYQYCLDMLWSGQIPEEVRNEFTGNAQGEIELIGGFVPELRRLAESAKKSLTKDYRLD